MRIYCAGILHNLLLALIGVLILWTLPYFMLPLYTNGKGVIVKGRLPSDVSLKFKYVLEIEPSSGLTGINMDAN